MPSLDPSPDQEHSLPLSLAQRDGLVVTLYEANRLLASLDA